MLRCPASYMDIKTASLARASSLVEAGILPDGGGIYDQTSSFWHAHNLYQGECAALMESKKK